MSNPVIRVVSAEIEEDGCYLIVQRPTTSVLPSLWEFPGGRVLPGESDEAALHRKTRELLGAAVEIIGETARSVHHYEDYSVEMVLLRARLLARPQRIKIQDCAFVPVERFVDYEFPAADQKTIGLLLEL